MKKALLAILITLMAIPAFAGVKILGGSSISGMLEQKTIPVVINWDNAVYAKAGSLQNFLDKAVRVNDWESESLRYLLAEINSRTGEYGIRFIPADQAPDAEYYLEIRIGTISKGGDILGNICLCQKTQNFKLFDWSFSSDDADDDDEIPFRDQFRSLGKSFGKTLQGQLKKIYSRKAR